MSYSGFLLDTGKPSSVQEPASSTRMGFTLEYYLNSFNATSMTPFSLPQQKDVMLKVFNVLGQCAERLDLPIG